MNTCLDCPSLITKEKAASHFGVSDAEVGDYVFCSRFGQVLGDQDGVRQGLAERFGQTCPSHGESVPAVAPKDPKMGFFMPRPDLLKPTANQKPSSCESCIKYDKSAEACAATGMLVFSSKAAATAAACSFGEAGLPYAAADVKLPAWSTTPVALSATSLAASSTPTSTSAPTAPSAPKPKKSLIILEPVNYNSDAKVMPDHANKGIQAWRRVTSPKGKDHFLPIFRTDFFTEDMQERIPKSGADYGDPSLFIDHDNILVEFAVQSYTKDLNLALIGEAGSGKTEGARYLAWMLNMPFARITYSEDTDPDEVLGFHHFGEHEVVDASGNVTTATGTYLKKGELPSWWQTMCVLLSDEPNIAREAIVQSYRSMNDSSRTLVVYGEKFLRHDYCFHIMAMNPHWDFRNIGAKPMASADSRRLSFHFVTPPNDDQIKQILTRAVRTLDGAEIDPGVLKAIIAAGKDLRVMAKDGRLPDTWTTSQEVKVARLVEDFGLEGAYRRAYFNYIDPETTKTAMQLIASQIPAGVDWS